MLTHCIERNRKSQLPIRKARAEVQKIYMEADEGFRKGGIFFKFNNFMFGMLFPALVRAHDNLIRSHEQLQIARVIVKVEKSRNDSGKLPESLKVLVQKYLDEVPEDSFSDGTVVFKKQGKGYMIYSVGIDGKEEPENEKGDDIVFKVIR